MTIIYSGGYIATTKGRLFIRSFCAAMGCLLFDWVIGTWIPLAITVLIFNGLQFVDIIIARHMVAGEGGLRSQLITLILEERSLTIGMVALLVVYRYT